MIRGEVATRARRRARTVPAIVAVLAACTAGCSSTSGEEAADPGTDSRPTVLLDFEDVPAGAVTAASDSGSMGGEAETEGINGGELRPIAGPDGQALRFPAFDSSSRPARAVLVLPADDTALDPGVRDFELGVDFMLDAESEGANDDGNNLVQRGLSADPVQYKLQVDHGAASCRVVGDQGEVTVTSQVTTEPRTWYRLSCSRAGDEVRLVLRSEEGEVLDEVTRNVRTGSLTFDPAVPLTMGGKVGADGSVVEDNSDQLNGALDNVFVHVG